MGGLRKTEGEGMGVGSRHSAVLNERTNKSLNRNNPSISRGSANPKRPGKVGKGSRKTGKTG